MKPRDLFAPRARRVRDGGTDSMRCAVRILACVLAMCSCGGAAVQIDAHPGDVLVAWHQALAQERPRDAWELLAPAAREGLSQEAFVALYSRRGPALTDRAKQMVEWAQRHPAAERAEVVVGAHRVWLVRARDGWRIDGAMTDSGAVDSAQEQ